MTCHLPGLDAPLGCVDVVRSHEIGVIPSLDDGAIHHGEDLIGVPDRCQPVGDGDGEPSTPIPTIEQILLDALLRLRIER